jgi:O-antigen/teichoic acid export membrane protein
MSPFRNILTLSIGDFIAKAAYFLSFVYMAKTLGVASYGVLEFALAIRTYLLLLADAGLDLWAVREAAKGVDVATLAARIIPARLVLAVLTLGATGLLYALPGNPNLRRILPLLALTVLVQAFNLKWVFMGQERMAKVALGLVASQLAFAVCAVLLVRQPSDLLMVPAAFLASEAVMAAYFWRLFVKVHGRPRLSLQWNGIRAMMQPVLTLGATQCLGLINYNVDSILIGVLMGPRAVGWYAAAYKPVTAVLAIPATYYLGLFPALSRSFREDKEKFRAILERSMRFTAIFAIPVGVGGTLLAKPMIHLLFGEQYAASVAPLQLLSWSAVLVTMRGNFRYTLNAVGLQGLDLRCAAAAAVFNIALNLLLIPRYGITGAAWATVISEIGWFTLAWYVFSQRVIPLPLLSMVWRPLAAGAGMAVVLILGAQVQWIARAALALGGYVLILILCREPEVMRALRLGSGWGASDDDAVPDVTL